MAKGTDFGGIHSHRDLNLIQQLVDVQPAEPKLNFIDVPGADGSKDISEQPAGRIVYKDRKVTWTFALYPGENWHDKHRQVSNALNGRRCRITLDDDPGYYYTGRLAVKKYNTDKTLRQITVEATCAPYRLKQLQTVISSNLNTTVREIILVNEKKPAFPVIEVSAEMVLTWGGSTFNVGAGTFSSLDIELQEGDNVLQAKTASGTGKITITYQEGAL